MQLSLIFKKGLNNLIFKRSFFRLLLVNVLERKRSREAFNRWYNRLGYESKSRFRFFFAKIFRNKKVKFKDVLWEVDFNNRVVFFPLTERNLWLVWDQAVSILGHDISIKITYEDLIRQKKVGCFFDVGANYGTHSLLFLSQGIKTVTFEPNPNCTLVFNELLRANNLTGEMVAGAVGEKDYETDLYFPEKDTWLGTLSEGTKADLGNKFHLTTVKTKVISLDSYLSESEFVPDLIKIDTEGYELKVLYGAVNTIIKFKPMIIFEENDSPKIRSEIFDFLKGLGYGIFKLPFLEEEKNRMNKIEFLQSTEINFIAVFVPAL